MNDLVVADRGADWRRLKALVLDSVSSPIARVCPDSRRIIHRLVGAPGDGEASDRSYTVPR